MIRSAMYNKRLFGPHFSDASINKHTYLDMPQNCFMPQLEILCNEDNASFQPDEAPTNYALAVREYVKEVSRDHWIGCRSPLLLAPLYWPPRSPDLSVTLQKFPPGLPKGYCYTVVIPHRWKTYQAVRPKLPHKCHGKNPTDYGIELFILGHENDETQTVPHDD